MSNINDKCNHENKKYFYVSLINSYSLQNNSVVVLSNTIKVSKQSIYLFHKSYSKVKLLIYFL